MLECPWYDFRQSMREKRMGAMNRLLTRDTNYYHDLLRLAIPGSFTKSNHLSGLFCRQPDGQYAWRWRGIRRIHGVADSSATANVHIRHRRCRHHYRRAILGKTRHAAHSPHRRDRPALCRARRRNFDGRVCALPYADHPRLHQRPARHRRGSRLSALRLFLVRLLLYHAGTARLHALR